MSSWVIYLMHLNPLRLLGKLESMKEKQNTNINATRFIGMEPNSGVSASPFDILRICLSKLLCFEVPREVVFHFFLPCHETLIH